MKDKYFEEINVLLDECTRLGELLKIEQGDDALNPARDFYNELLKKDLTVEGLTELKTLLEGLVNAKK